MFEKALPLVLKFEGGYVNHPLDKGGATNKGVTQKTYDSYRTLSKLPLADVKNITSDEVTKIYLRFWKGAKCDRIAPTHPSTAFVHFDCAINSGPSRAAKILQKSLGVASVDGIIGSITLGAIAACDDSKLSAIYLANRDAFYNAIVKRNPSQKVFLKGWLKRTNHIRVTLDEWARGSK